MAFSACASCAKNLAHTEIMQRDNSQPQMDKGVGWAVVCWGWNLVLCYQCMVERTREQLKYTYLHLFVNRQSKNSLADLCYWLRLEIMVALQAAILTFLAFAYETDSFFLVQSHGWSYSFLRKFAIINEALLFCYISFKIRQSFFDNKEFLKKIGSYHDGPLFSSCR